MGEQQRQGTKAGAAGHKSRRSRRKSGELHVLERMEVEAVVGRLSVMLRIN